MALPSGNFASANAGRLVVIFSGVYSATSSDFGTGGYGSDIVVQCQLLDNAGTVVAAGTMSRSNGGVALVADYPGGGVTYSCTATHITHSIQGGAGSVSVSMRISVRLEKR